MSNYFDPQAKENKIYLDYFENKKWLIIDPALSTRSSLKKTLQQIGSKQALMQDTDNFKMALETIQLLKPDFVIASRFMTGGSVVDLFYEHQKTNPNRLKSGFFVISEENSLSEVAHSLNYEMDGLISFPFTGASVISAIMASAKHKVDPTTYLLKLNLGREQYFNNQIDFAESFFEEALKLDDHPFEALYYSGLLHYKKGEIDQAIDKLEDAYFHNPNHFKTIHDLSIFYYEKHRYKDAYELSVALVQKFPTPPDIIPKLVHLSVINKNYGDIINYFKIFSKIENPPKNIQKSMSAGLATLGIYFSNTQNFEKARESLLLSFKYSEGKYEILETITRTFEKMNMLKALVDEFLNTDTEQWPPNSQGFYFHAVHKTVENHQEVMGLGDKLLRQKIKNPLIEIGMIERGIESKRKLGSIESLVQEASRKYPESAAIFEALLQKARGILT